MLSLTNEEKEIILLLIKHRITDLCSGIPSEREVKEINLLDNITDKLNKE